MKITTNKIIWFSKVKFIKASQKMILEVFCDNIESVTFWLSISNICYTIWYLGEWAYHSGLHSDKSTLLYKQIQLHKLEVWMLSMQHDELNVGLYGLSKCKNNKAFIFFMINIEAKEF